MPNPLVPPGRPDITRMEVRALMRAAGMTEPKGPYLFGRRGYYRDSMGRAGRNDRGIYDDAIVLVTPSRVVTFNANTDPSKVRRGLAMLKPGVWLFQEGIHNRSKDPARYRRRPALVQASEFTVVRDGTGEDSGWFGINIHDGGEHSTTSEGCITIPPAQWPFFLGEVQRAMRVAGVKTIPLVLTARPDDA